MLNELCCSPEATLQPLLQIIHAVTDLCKSSVYSSNASFILYMVGLAIDVETFICYALQQAKQDEWDPARGSLANVDKLQEYRKKIHEYLHGVGLGKGAVEGWCVGNGGGEVGGQGA